MLKTQSLSQVIRKTWNNYEKKVQQSRSHTSPKNIHQLRISIQKFEAILTVSHSLHSTHHSKNIIALIKNVRKSLGPLRDIQVESTALENLKDDNLYGHKQREFSIFFEDQKVKAKKKAFKCLKKISLDQEHKRIERLAKKIEKIEKTQDKSILIDQLEFKMKSKIIQFTKILKEIDPERIKEIHRFRIKAKKLRYQGECVNSITGLSKYDLPHLKQVQSVAGRIQNDNVLISTLEKFLKIKKNEDDPKALKIKKLIQDNQAQLIKKDFNEITKIKWQN